MPGHLATLEFMGVATHTIEVPGDVAAGKLLRVLVRKLAFPIVDPSHLEIAYELLHVPTRSVLAPSKTLIEQGVQEGDRVRLFHEPFAGGPASPGPISGAEG